MFIKSCVENSKQVSLRVERLLFFLEKFWLEGCAQGETILPQALKLLDEDLAIGPPNVALATILFAAQGSWLLTYTKKWKVM